MSGARQPDDWKGPGRDRVAGLGLRLVCHDVGLHSEIIQIHQDFDWVTQVAVPFGAAVIGAVAVLLATDRQVKASAREIQGQLAAQRKAQQQESEAADLDMMESARQELRVNVEALQRTPLFALSTEFTHRLLASGRIRGVDEQSLLTQGFLSGERFNAYLAMAGPGTEAVVQRTAKQTALDMANAEQAIMRLLSLRSPSAPDPPRRGN